MMLNLITLRLEKSVFYLSKILASLAVVISTIASFGMLMMMSPILISSTAIARL